MKYLILLLLLGAIWISPVQAAGGSCTVLSGAGATLVDFGVYNAVMGDADGSGSINLICTPALPAVQVSYAIAIGTGGAGRFNPRRLGAGGFSLAYNLYVDPTRLLIWGDASAGTSVVSGACTGTCQVSVYGRIFGGQAVPAMQYRDDVLVTLEF